MRELANLLKKNLPHNFQQYLPNETIILQGEDSSKVIVADEGWIKLSVYSLDGRDSIVAFCGPGFILGLPTIFRPIPYPVSASALTKTAVSVFEKAKLEQFLLQHPECMARVVAVLGHEVTYIKDMGIAAGSEGAIEKVFNLLFHLATTYGIEDELSWKIPFKLTQQHISDITGLSRVRISACLKILAKQKKIRITNKQYSVFQK